MKTIIYITNSITVVLLALWIPIGLYQMLHYETFKTGILRQPIGDGLAWALIYLLPAVEITTACLLVSQRSRKTGLLLSSVLLTAFTGYIILVLLGVWGTPPCSCGLAIPQMGWTNHLWFNLLFMIISIIGWLMLRRQQNTIENKTLITPT